MELVRELEHESDEEQLYELGVFSLEKEGSGVTLPLSKTTWMEAGSQVGVSLFFQATSDGARGNKSQVAAEEV